MDVCCRRALKSTQQGTVRSAVAATTAVLNAVKIAGGTDYDALSRALKSSVVDTAIGKIKFDAKGDAEGVGFSLYQVKNGTFAEVK